MSCQRYTSAELGDFPVGTLITVLTADGPYMALRADEGEGGPGAASTGMAQVASGRYWSQMADWGPIQILRDPRVNDLDQTIRLQRQMLELEDRMSKSDPGRIDTYDPVQSLISDLRDILRW